jgi:GntR family transcriptional regulator
LRGWSSSIVGDFDHRKIARHCRQRLPDLSDAEAFLAKALLLDNDWCNVIDASTDVSFEKKNSTRALYLQVRDHLAQHIARGTLKPGAALPNELQFAEQLGVSLGTLRKGLETLEKERLVVRRQGSGTFVRDYAAEPLPPLDNIRTKTGALIPFTVQVLDVEEGQADAEEQKRLALGGPNVVARCRQVRHHNGPFMVEQITLALSQFAGLSCEQLTSPYHIAVLAQKHGVLLGAASECVEITAATPEIAGLLHLAPGTPLLKLDRVHYSLYRVPLEWRVGYCELTSVKYVSRVNVDAA